MVQSDPSNPRVTTTTQTKQETITIIPHTILTWLLELDYCRSDLLDDQSRPSANKWNGITGVERKSARKLVHPEKHLILHSILVDRPPTTLIIGVRQATCYSTITNQHVHATISNNGLGVMLYFIPSPWEKACFDHQVAKTQGH